MRLSVFLFLTCWSALAFAQPGLLIENRGQWPADVIASAEIEQGRFFLNETAIRYHFFDLSSLHHAHHEEVVKHLAVEHVEGHVFDMKLVGAQRAHQVEKNGPSVSKYNYFLGNDKSKWASNCSSFERILQSNVYPGIDWDFKRVNGSWKHEFVVRPGANPNLILMQYDGASSLSIEDGVLKVETSVGELWEQKPFVYQTINGRQLEVRAEFVLKGNTVCISLLDAYDPKYAITIDPELIFASYSGSFSNNFGFTATFDSEGNLYSGSSAFGNQYPTTIGAYQTTWAGGNGTIGSGTDIALSKYDASGTFLHWSSYLGGSNDELPHSLICNEFDELILYGTTSSPNFPTTSTAYDNSYNGGSAFAPQGVGASYVNGSDIVVVHFNSSGSALIGSTFIGGSGNDGVNTASNLKFNYADEFRGEIDLDSAGNIVIASATYSTDFPTVNAVQNTLNGAQDACLFKLSPDCTSLLWSTFLGGANNDSGYSAAFDAEGNMYFAGGTNSSDFPTTFNALHASYLGGSADGWIARFTPSGNFLSNSTYYGSGAYDQLYFVDLDSDNNVYVYGQTLASGSTLVVNAAWSQPNSGMLVSKLNNTLSALEWSTVFGTGSGKVNLSPGAFLVDVCNNIYLSGWGGAVNTSSNTNTDNTIGMLVTSDAHQSTTDGSDFYLLVLEADASNVVYASFFGGNLSPEHVDGGTSRFDRKGVIYQSVCAGCQDNDDFPTFPTNVVSTVNNSSGCNNGVFKFDFELPITTADFAVPPTSCVAQTIQITSNSVNAETLQWLASDGYSQTGPVFNHAFSEAGEYNIQLIATHPGTCNGADTLERSISILEPEIASLQMANVCSYATQILGPEEVDPQAIYNWTPSDFLDNADVANPTFTPGNATNYVLTIARGICTDTLFQTVEVTPLSLTTPADTVLCDEGMLDLNAQVTPGAASIFWSDDALFTNIINDNPADASISVDVAFPQTFYVRVENGACVLQDEVNVNFQSFLTEIEGDFTTCVNDTVSLTIVNANAELQYNWSPTNLVISGQSTSMVNVRVPETTLFYVQSLRADGCEALDSVLVTVSELSLISAQALATPNLVVEGQTVQLSSQPAGYSYLWSPSISLNNSTLQNPVATPLETTTYSVTITDGECSANASVRVRVEDFVCGTPSIYIPNAFTPNADGKNELLKVRGNNITGIYFALYDRWGEKVFETTSLEHGWDGKFKGKDCDPAVYVYYLEIDCAGGASFIDKGNITLIR